jgi:hypothetical protein
MKMKKRRRIKIARYFLTTQPALLTLTEQPDHHGRKPHPQEHNWKAHKNT